MKYIIIIMLLSGIAIGQTLGWQSGVPSWVHFGVAPTGTIDMLGDTLEVDGIVRASKFTSPLATSYMSLVGDTLFITREGASGDFDQVFCFVDELGNKRCFYWDDSTGSWQFVGGARFFGNSYVTGVLTTTGGVRGHSGNIRLSRTGLETTVILPNFQIDAYIGDSGTIISGKTGDGDIEYHNSYQRGAFVSVSAEYTLGVAEVVFCEQTANEDVNLPASPTTGDYFRVIFTHASGGNLDGNGKNINGAATQAAAQYGAFLVVYNGTQWLIF